jgi:lipopolysaccharide export LptBFGC system permease protein LptF
MKRWKSEEPNMRIAISLVVIFLGFVIAFLSLGLTSSVGGRLALVVVGIAVSLFGIMGMLNRHYMKNAIWKKG